MDRVRLVYCAFYILLFLVALFNGRKLSTCSRIRIKDFWPTIVAYTLFAGLRWGRGTDYNVYYWPYQQIAAGFNPGFEPVFYAIAHTISSLGGSWQFMVAFMSFLLIFSVCYFLKQFRAQLYVLLPLIVFSLGVAENLMRWYMAFSFFLLAMFFHLSDIKHKKYLVGLFVLASISTHYGFVLPMIIFVLLWFFAKKYSVNPYLASILYIACMFLFRTDMMLFFEPYLQVFDFTGRFVSYRENAAGWLTGEMNDFADSTKMISIKALPNIIIIFLGAIWSKKSNDLRYKYIYILTVFSIVFSPIASQIEIYYRINAVISTFKIIMIAFLFDMYRKKIVREQVVAILILFVFYAKLYTIFSWPLTCGKQDTYFIWDSNNRPTLVRTK